MTTREGQTTRDVPRGQCASPVGRSVSASSPGWRHPSGRRVWSGKIADANAFANVRSFTRSLTAPPKKSAATDAIHFFSVPFANKVGAARARPPSIHPSIPCPKWTIPLPFLPSPLLSLGMFSCAHVRANYFSISRVFDCSRQSSTSSSVDRPSKHDTFPLPRRGRGPAGSGSRRDHNLCPHLGREKSGSQEEDRGVVRRRPTHMRPTVDRTWYLESASSLAVTTTAENDGWTIRHLTGAAAFEPDN